MNYTPSIGARVKMNRVRWNPEAEGKTGTVKEIVEHKFHQLVISVDPPYDHWENPEYFTNEKDVELLHVARTHQVKP